jgi:NADPH:quinone reductase-like Zn-dependent oxidoreductase
MLARKPGAIGPVEAAAVPVVAVTAWQMLFVYGRLQPGQTVLIHGAAGNVGGFAVQLARLHGLKVVATARSREIGVVQELGASRVIDIGRAAFEQETEPVDAVLDTVGGEAQQRSLSVLKPGGTLVSTVSPPDAEEARRRGVTARFFLVEVTTAALMKIADLIEARRLKVRVGTVLPVRECRRAHEMLDGLLPHEPGKIVLDHREA